MTAPKATVHPVQKSSSPTVAESWLSTVVSTVVLGVSKTIWGRRSSQSIHFTCQTLNP
jgi:hypothetical protein